MSTKHIPQDIVDCVIFFLRDDQKTLLDTSIVSKAWINPSRRHLFHKIKVERRRGVFPFDFLAFVETNPHIATHIKQLRIQGDVDNDAFPQLLAALPNLSVLSIRDWFSPMREIAGPVERRYTLEYLLLDVMSSGRNYFGHEDEETTMPGIIDVHEENGQEQDDDDDGDNDDDEEEEEEDVDEETTAGSIDSDGSEISEAGGTQWDPSLIDATRLSNLLSLFSSVQELDLRTQPFYYHDWTLTNSQLAEILPDHRRSKLAVKAFKSSHKPSQSYFEFFHKILDLGLLEELVIKNDNFPTCTALGTLIRESTSLWKISLELGEYRK
ncbi:hypothetical protein NLI96_g5514 [Meripilus lineatus]|uniref:Uncharacterized protein n=1 Tax=Meripilus lineatus TaxID=2056292 RepID=A0AAD5YGV4_9APHY|nr:hypothetical protein NLI96_g5514 [Physisporinus lineatus]